ncbi:conserved hypothetical protein [Cenarchaeum symbiosum A]|uniref:RNA-binding protein n=1 Tax=Cenarchaeum symbiosum (strain A) TaxID=414004 RepID=A0RWA7_CENSY|nr:conserved hypothetical protein [Cenarchaeum symbiosum A]
MELSVAIPDSCLADESTQMDKSRKASVIARACSVFGVSAVYVYKDGGGDGRLLTTILRYLETPPFLRKRLFPRINELKYAGVLSPLRIPSHTASSDPKSVSRGDVREGVVLSKGGRKFVDIGLGRPVPYSGQTIPPKRVTVRFERAPPDPVIREIPREEAGAYWGYRVKERGRLGELLSGWKGRIILTSRKGSAISQSGIRSYAGTGEVLVVFGSTDKGIHGMLGGGTGRVQNARVLNFFPGQSSETVRLEEAMLGTFAILRSGV